MRPSLSLFSAITFVCLAATGCARHAPVALPPQAMSAQADAQFDLSLCPSGIDPSATRALATVPPPGPGKCAAAVRNGHPLPAANCTPGAINPTLTLAVLQDPNFRTACVRNNLTSEQQKGSTYTWYSLDKPAGNTGQTQVCELDHVVPLYLGGADSLDNIWPQCGPTLAALNDRYFKQKDRVELYLGEQVRAGAIPLRDAQRGIARDWTQYLSPAKKRCAHSGCKNLAAAREIE